MSDEQCTSALLTDAQKSRIERNKQKAQLLRKSRVKSHPYPAKKDKSKNDSESSVGPLRVIDTGAGFFLGDDEEESAAAPTKVIREPAPLIGVENLICDDCGKEFLESFLFNHFDVPVCDTCRRSEDNDEEKKYPLVTKSTARDTYLLKDADLDKREPALRFIEKKNPHQSHWGVMKLYLEKQVYERAMEVWGDEDALEAAHDKKAENRDKVKQKRFDKKVKELRMAVRSSLWKKDTSSHVHEFGEEVYDEEEDIYRQTCSSCGHEQTYEKM